MSVCKRCGAPFTCAMADDTEEACWCTALPHAVVVPQAGQASCWCPSCLSAHIALQSAGKAGEGGPAPD